ncbi:MAG: hypothetical protein LIO59_00925, partial [Oscillospiraceae bacterium]|nr:hypothetical protein [Oscillospiraceae bacterium]
TAMVMLFSVFAYAGVPLASAVGESLRIMETEASSEAEFDLLAELFDISISNNDDGFFTAKVGGTEATQANEGDTVTIEADLPDGSVLNGISVDKSGTAVEVTKLTDTSYSFEMPSSNVTVSPDVTLPDKITFENSESDFEISDGKYHQANDTVTLTTTFTTMKYVKNLVGTYVSGSSTCTISLENGITVGDGGTANDIKQYTYTFTMPKSDLILSADMITLPKIEVDSDYDGDGNITISPVDEDTEVVFANTPMKISLNETFIDGEDTYVLYDLQVVPTDSTVTPLFLGLGITKEADGDYRFNAPESDAKVKAFYYKLSSEASSEDVVAVVEQNDVRTGYTSLKTAIESGVTADGNEAIIIMIADSEEAVMTVSADKNIRLVNNGSDRTVKRAAAGQGDFITVASDAVLTLGGEGSQSNIIIDGGAEWTKIDEKVDPRRDPSTEANWQGTAYSDTPTKVLFQDGDSWEDCYWFTRGGFTATGSLINNSGTLNLYDGAKLTNNFNATQDNRGGAIYNSSTINMYGGEISWCTARRSNQGTGAGIYSASGTTINMYGGAIKNNTNIDVGATYSSGNNRSGDGAGIAIDSGVLNMYGGEISQNHSSSDTSSGDGGGIIAREGAKIYLRGGKISANYTAGYGGGILLYLSYLYIYDGEISNNYSGYGGAVGMSQGYVTMFGGSISGNAAKYGGGVCIGSYNYNTGCSFDMYGGSIVSNTADYGGGICNYNGGGNYANLRGGKISDNTADTGKGVAIVNMS